MPLQIWKWASWALGVPFLVWGVSRPIVWYNLYKSPLGYFFYLTKTSQPHSVVSKSNVFESDDIQVIPIPIFSDNYAYVIVDVRSSAFSKLMKRSLGSC